ncbi:MAG: electron transfer flavoprotein-ubiquinone oxidoreductase, partial [Mangrovicoccus sp.]
FQRFKHHPMVAELLKGGKRVAYGARAITEGGWQSLPDVAFPGGALLGCSAGMVNVPRIKGNHNAIYSGMAAADAAIEAMAEGREGDTLSAYAEAVVSGPIAEDMKPVRNVKPIWSKYGLNASLMLGGMDMWTNHFGFSLLGTLGHGKTDAKATRLAKYCEPIDYPKPDGVLSFDRLTNVSFAFTNHEESQPAHLKLGNDIAPIMVDLRDYAGPSTRYCPAGVYEFVEEEDKDPRFVVNFQNCVHCKTCDIKDPAQNITWTTPQGGDGPNYPNM